MKGKKLKSSNINFRCPDKLRETIEKVSAKKDRSMSYTIVKILEDHIDKY